MTGTRIGVGSGVTYWIVPPERSLIFTKLQTWNSDHQGWQFALATAKHEWPFIDFWDTPEFYFLKTAKWLIGSRVGRVTVATNKGC